MPPLQPCVRCPAGSCSRATSNALPSTGKANQRLVPRGQIPQPLLNRSCEALAESDTKLLSGTSRENMRRYRQRPCIPVSRESESTVPPQMPHVVD